MDLKAFYRAELDEHAAVLRATLAHCEAPFLRLFEGGADGAPQHLATELTVRYIRDRDPIAAVALTTDTSALTAIGNDLGFDQLFARQLRARGRKGDLALAITTSGKSPNVILALQAARQMGITATAFGGKGGG